MIPGSCRPSTRRNLQTEADFLPIGEEIRFGASFELADFEGALFTGSFVIDYSLLLSENVLQQFQASLHLLSNSHAPLSPDATAPFHFMDRAFKAGVKMEKEAIG